MSDSSNTAEKNGVPVIVWIHGGGFFIGGPSINDIVFHTSPYLTYNEFTRWFYEFSVTTFDCLVNLVLKVS